MPHLSAKQVAEMVGGEVLGPGDVAIDDLKTLQSAAEGDLAVLRDAKGKAEAESCGASVMVTPVKLESYGGTQVVCPDAESALAALLEVFAAERHPRPEGVSPRASVSPTARLGTDVAIGEFAVVSEEAEIGDGAVIYPNVYVGSGCRIGPRTVLHANVSVHHGVRIGADCVIHYNAAIGAEGFGFIQRDGRNVKLAQIGTVIIGDRVEIGALTTVDRAMLDATVIEDGVKIDNHCHVAHNCRVGAESIMAGSAKLAGSVRLGRGVIVAVDVGIRDHVTVGDGAVLGARSGVWKDVEPGAVLLGSPARPIREARRVMALTGRLPEIARRLRALEAEVRALRRQLGEQADD